MRVENFLRELRNLGLAAVVSIAAFFANNQVIVPDIMESRNIIAAREMVYDGHWLVPTLNGELRLEKPPLPTWLTALAEIMQPDSLTLQRGMAGLAALLLVSYFWRFARQVLRTEPLVPTLLLCTCYNVILAGRTASWDIFCHAFMMGGIYHIARALSLPPCAWRHFLAAGLFAGLSVMSKGPVSLYALFLPFLFSYAYFYRPSAKGKGLALALMVVVAATVGLWWFEYVHIAQTDALAAVVQKETGAWLAHNVRPWWYYWKFFLEAGVWAMLLPTSMLLPLLNKKRRTSRHWLFSVVWMLASLVLLSLIPEKKSRYLLPLLIPAAYVMGNMMAWWNGAFRDRASSPAADRWCFRANALAVALAVALLPVAAWLFLLRPGYIALGGWTVVLLSAVALFLYLLRAAVRLRPMALLGGVTLLFFATECFVLPLLGNVINNPERKSVAATRTMKELEGLPFYHLDSEPLRIEIVYAAHRSVRPLRADSLHAKLPCVLLTRQPVQATLTEESLSGVKITPVGRYDDNPRPKGNRRYSGEFISYVTLLQAENAAEQE